MCRTCPLLHRTDICGVVQRLPRRVSVPQAQVRFLPPLLMKFTAMKILTLIIKQKWFDAILSGEKTVETREVRPTNTKYISYRDNNTGKVYKKDSDVPESAWDSEKGVDTVINHYDAIQFCRLRKESPRRAGRSQRRRAGRCLRRRDERADCVRAQR